MSIFDELNEQYGRFEAALNAQHQILVKILGDFTSGYEKYLGLTSRHWHHDDGKMGDRYVRLGTGSPDNFKELPWFQFGSSAGTVAFSFAVTLETREGKISTARCTYVFEGKLTSDSDKCSFDFDGLPAPFVLSDDEAKRGEFEAIYAALTNVLRQKFDPSSILNTP